MIVNFNQIVLVLFLLANLAVALYATRRVQTMDEYVKANKNLPSSILIATCIATLISTGTINVKLSYAQGLISLSYALFFAITAVILGKYVLTRLVHFNNEYSLASIMGVFYGPFARVFTVIISTLFSSLIIISQLVALGELSELLGVNAKVIIIAGGLFITTYTFLGGIRAVASTDMFQMLVICTGLFMFTLIVIHEFKGLTTIIEAVPKHEDYLSFWTYPGFGKKLLRVFFWAIFPTMLISPPVIQRVLMARKKKDVQTMFISFAFIYLVLRVLTLLVGFTRFSLARPLSSVEGVPLGRVIALLCSSSLGRLLFLLVGCAAMMSTMDSFLNSLSILIVHDLLRPIQLLKNNNPIKQVKITCLLIGLSCTGIALVFKKMGFVNIQGYSTMLFSSITIPFLFGTWGLKGSKRAFLVSMFTFFSTLILPFIVMERWEVIKNGISGIVHFIGGGTLVGNYFLIFRALWFLAIITSTIAFLATHYWEHGEFRLVARVHNAWKIKNRYSLRSLFGWLLAPRRWAASKVKQSGDRSYFFSIMTICYFLIPYLSDPQMTSISYWKLYLFRLTGAIVAFGTLSGKKLWSNRLKSYFDLYYLGAIFFSLCLVVTFTAIADINNPLTPFHLIFALTAMGALVDWRTFLLFQVLGTVGATTLHRAVTGHCFIAPSQDQLLPLFIAVVVGFSFVGFFFKHKNSLLLQQAATIRTFASEKQKVLRSITESEHQLVSAIKRKSMTMKDVEKRLDLLSIKLGDDKDLKAIATAMKYFYNTSQQATRYLRMNITDMPIATLLNAAWRTLDNKGLNPTDHHIQLSQRASAKQIIGDLFFLKTLLVNATEYGIKQSKAQPFRIILQDSFLNYDLPDTYDNTPKPAISIILTNQPTATIPTQQVYQPYQENSAFVKTLPAPLKNNIRIIKAHFGFFSFSTSPQGFIQHYVLPLNLKSIRPAIEYFVYEELFEQVIIDSPEEQAFLQSVSQKGMDKAQVSMAMKIAKHYHFPQKRKSGEPFYTHPLAVARILLRYTNNQNVIIAALLHDTLEDTPYDVNQMETRFGSEVTRIVRAVTHLYSADERPKIMLAKQSTLDQLIAKGNSNSLMVKLVDRLHNMRTIEGHPKPAKRKKIANETLAVFIPIAQRLGLKPIEKELRTLAQKVLAR